MWFPVATHRITWAEAEQLAYLNMQAKCVIDDNGGCHGKILRGVPIVGNRDMILEAALQYGIDEIVTTISGRIILSSFGIYST